MIPVQEVVDMLTKIHDILDNALFKQVGSTAHILVPLFNSASRQLHEVWVSQYPFLYIFKDPVPPSDACLYGHIDWSLEQDHHLPLLCLSLQLLRGWKTRPRVGF